MKKILLVYALLVALGCILNAKTIWRDRNPYATDQDLRAGSVIVINVNDISEMRFNLTMSDKSTSAVSSNPDMAITGFLPKVAADRRIVSDDGTQFAMKGRASFSIATRVLRRVGTMVSVAGSRTYTLNGVTDIITVTGLVDPAMIKGRSVDSGSVADFTMEIRGVKRGVNIERPPIKEGETANTGLTEEEKQRIIIDYLKKMLGELTR